MNIRSVLNNNSPYHSINREERNLAAIFYHILLINNNLTKFLTKIGEHNLYNLDEIEVYFEYAYLRDIWDSIDKNNNEVKRKLILEYLNPANIEFLKTSSIVDFNEYFGARSTKFIESPGNWCMSKFQDHFPDNTEFLNTCRFKWSYNAKPDIVIILPNDQAICIEAKFNCKEGKYPSILSEKKEFDRRSLKRVGQIDMQKMIMAMLGYECKFVSLVKNRTLKDLSFPLFWKDAFEGLDLTGCPKFILEWIKRL